MKKYFLLSLVIFFNSFGMVNQPSKEDANNNAELITTTRNDDLTKTAALLQQGADPNYYQGRPTYYAVKNGNLEMTILLLKAGAYPRVVFQQAISAWDIPIILNLLNNHRISVHSENNILFHTALNRQDWNLLKLLLQYHDKETN